MDISASQLIQWFSDHKVKIGDGKVYTLDEEQAAVILDEHKNTLVVARAGSGKTTTLIAKIIYLTQLKGVEPGHIIALGFNRKAQEEFRDKLSATTVDEKRVFASNTVVRTFDALAGRAIEHGEPISDEDQTSYINKITEKVVDPKSMYQLIRDDTREPDRNNYADDKEYYAAVRAFSYKALDGDFVKSHGEKIIADYLFERGIEYKYEGNTFAPYSFREFAKDAEAEDRLGALAEEFKPDFVLPEYNIVWEHWGISDNETPEEIAEINKSGVIGNYEKYREKMYDKKWFYGKEWLDKDKVKLKIESLKEKTDYEDDSTEIEREISRLEFFLKFKPVYTHYESGVEREKYEEELEQLMEENGVKHEKLSEEILIQKFMKKTPNPGAIAKNIRQFIQRAEQQFPGEYAELEQACKKYNDPQLKQFYEMALNAYKFYLSELLANPKDGKRGIIDEFKTNGKLYTTDYKLLMNEATAAINNHAEKPDFTKLIEEAEYLFMDEYQDFSLLFNNFIQSIIKRNPKLKVTAVGDNCQAINGFMGASLEYFDNFEKYFPEDYHRMYIHTNFRSTLDVIEMANAVMENALDEHELSKVDSKSEEKNQHYEDSLNYCCLDMVKRKQKWDKGKSGGQRKLELVLKEIMDDNPKDNILVLSRTKDYTLPDTNKRVSQEDFKEFFVKRFKKHFFDKNQNVEERIKGMTIHNSKGLESDIVVALNPKPILHPDNYLFEVFGVTEGKVLDEEKRLFYVEMTRAKKKVYVINNKATSMENPNQLIASLDTEKFKEYKKDVFLGFRDRILKYPDGTSVPFNAVKIIISKSEQPSMYKIVAYNKEGERLTDGRAILETRGDIVRKARECSEKNPVRLYATPFRKSPRTGVAYRGGIIQISAEKYVAR